MYNCPMMGSGAGMVMMAGMWLIWLLTIVLLVLGIAALVKYLRSGAGMASRAQDLLWALVNSKAFLYNW